MEELRQWIDSVEFERNARNGLDEKHIVFAARSTAVCPLQEDLIGIRLR